MMTMDDLKNEEDELRKVISALSTEQKKEYYRLEESRIKDPDTYAVLNYFFLAGLHHFYLGKYAPGVLNLIAMLIGLVFFEFYGWVLFVIVIVIELPQLFRSQTIVQKYNNNVMRETLNEVS
jgi:TM2 domain-containing membrane protein YozV